jgi:hypothetical protein
MIAKNFYISVLYLARLFAGKKVGFLNSTFITSFQTVSTYPKLNLNQRRYYSTKLPGPGSVKYTNADVDKLRILTENRGKSGIYMWTNLINGKRYIGSSVDLKRRLLEYFNANRLLKESSMTINRALLKHGYSARARRNPWILQLRWAYGKGKTLYGFIEPRV